MEIRDVPMVVLDVDEPARQMHADLIGEATGDVKDNRSLVCAFGDPAWLPA